VLSRARVCQCWPFLFLPLFTEMPRRVILRSSPFGASPKSDLLLMQRIRSSCWLPQKSVCSYTLRGVSWVPPTFSITEGGILL
jgi:hypothetical protein